MGKEKDRGDTNYNCYSGCLDSPEEFEKLELEAQMWVLEFVWWNR
jgi:hypothetical protein